MSLFKISVRLFRRLVYSCIFLPCDLLPHFPLPHFQSPRFNPAVGCQLILMNMLRECRQVMFFWYTLAPRCTVQACCRCSNDAVAASHQRNSIASVSFCGSQLHPLHVFTPRSSWVREDVRIRIISLLKIFDSPLNEGSIKQRNSVYTHTNANTNISCYCIYILLIYHYY